MDTEPLTMSMPNQTLYINNLNEKIKLDELKTTLFQLCSQYGEVLNIVASKAIKKRGQAFVVYNNSNSATMAKKELSEAVLFGKKINVQYSKAKSDHILNKEGGLTQEMKSKLQLERKARRDEEYKAIRERTIEQREKELNAKHSGNGYVNRQFPPGFNQGNNNSGLGEYSDKNSILFIDDLPKDINEDQLKGIFDKYTGFKEIRLHTGRGVCFVEFDNEINAESAMIGLNQIDINNNHLLNITFAKK